jgi:folate-dependent phosphoribosylglycinamide formyltransferase PurN
MIQENKIKIGLLLDDLSVPTWVNTLVNDIQSDPRFILNCIVLNKGSKTPTRSSFLYRLLRKTDERLMSLSGNPFKRVKLNIVSTKIIDVVPIRKKYSDYFPDETIQKINEDKPDVFLRFGFRILRGKILSASRFGIFSLHHGDTATFRGGPPAFWEVAQKYPLTAVTLQVLTERLDAGIILAKTFLRTDSTSFYRNQQKIYWAGYKLFLEQLQQLTISGIENYINSRQSSFTNEPQGRLYRNPNNIKSFFLLLNYFIRGFFRFISQKVYHNQWQILLANQSVNDFKNSPKKILTLSPPKDRIWADPFLAKAEGKYYLFFEEKLNQFKNAHISCFELNEKGEPVSNKPIEVLKENHHLSYPFVFYYNNHYYMIPESADINSVVLYKSNEFPYRWEKSSVLLEGQSIYDSTLHHHTDGYWYLFCTAKKDNRFSSDAYFHIYYSSSLESPFQAHPQNPIYSDVRKSRPAGALFYNGKDLIRPAQISAPHYGFGINYFKIQNLSPIEFKEEMIFEQLPMDGYRSTHTRNQLDNLVAYDAQKKVFKIF